MGEPEVWPKRPRALPAMKIDDYELRHQLNKGGMAQVWLAQRRWTDGKAKAVVIKLPLSQVMSDERQKRLFLDEARVMMQLDHANIVPVFDAGLHEGMPWLAMRYVPGRNVSELVRAIVRTGHDMDFAIAAYVARNVAYALRYAHGYEIEGVSQNIVHRDVAAKNVMISGAGEVLLTDFGVASALSIESTNKHVKGTFRYMAPEHALGHAGQKSDAFGLGTILFSLIEGKEFRWDIPPDQIIHAATSGHITQLLRQDIPARLRAVVEGLLEYDEHKRMSIEQAVTLLEEFPGRQTALSKLMGRYFGAAEMRRSGHTSAHFQASADLDQAVKIGQVLRGARHDVAPDTAMERSAAEEQPPAEHRNEQPQGAWQDELDGTEGTVDVSVPAAVRRRPDERTEHLTRESSSPAPAVPPTERLPFDAAPPLSAPRADSWPPSATTYREPGASSESSVAKSSAHGEVMAFAARPADSAPVVSAGPTDPASVETSRRRLFLVPLASLLAVLLVGGTAMLVWHLRGEDEPSAAAQSTSPEAPTEPPVAVAARPTLAKAEPEIVDPAAIEAEGDPPFPSTQPEVPSEVEADPKPPVGVRAERELEDVADDPSPTAAPSDVPQKKAPTKPVPKVSLRIALGFIDQAQVRVAGRTYSLTKARAEVTVSVPTGARAVRWRFDPSAPWRRKTVDFRARKDYFILVKSSGIATASNPVEKGSGR